MKAALKNSASIENDEDPEDESEDKNEKPHWHGHRQRLRERLFNSGPDSLQDYELLEILLGTAIPRRDVKPLAKQLLEKFKNLWSLLHASPAQLTDAGLSEAAAGMILTTGAIVLRAQRSQIMNKPLLNSWQRIVDYCQAAMGHAKKEQFRLLFLDRHNHLIHEEVQQRGTIDHTPVYPREVVQRALDLGAGAIVLVHNHPSGDPTPSQPDIEMTRQIIAACKPLDIMVHDHLIIGHGKTASFKALGLI